MRVLFLGQTGIDKRNCVERLARHCLAEAGFPDDLEHSRSMDHLRVYHLEDKIGDRAAGDYISFLDRFNIDTQRQEWNAAWDDLKKEVSGNGSKHEFITLHASYFRKNRFFSALDPVRVRNFGADMVITLIDDAYECWDRIQERERTSPRGTKLRLRDVFLWRTAEIMAADLILSGTGIPHFVVAIKHPQETVRRLIFERGVRRVYACFPISSTREKPEHMEMVNDFRTQLRQDLIVFDPLTIDERLLITAFENRAPDSKTIVVGEGLRWPLDDLDSLGSRREASAPIEIPTDQVGEVIKDIDHQIRIRDFQLIAQSEALAAFRPEFGGHRSGGVAAEIQYASDPIGIPVHVLWNDAEDGSHSKSPFGNLGTKHASVSSLISAIKE